MNELAKEIMSVLKNVRDGKTRIPAARQEVERKAEVARAPLRSGSDGRILLDILEDSANAYLNSIEKHPEERASMLDPALEAVQRKAERCTFPVEEP
jgi:hypothetical protein